MGFLPGDHPPSLKSHLSCSKSCASNQGPSPALGEKVLPLDLRDPLLPWSVLRIRVLKCPNPTQRMDAGHGQKLPGKSVLAALVPYCLVARLNLYRPCSGLSLRTRCLKDKSPSSDTGGTSWISDGCKAASRQPRLHYDKDMRTPPPISFTLYLETPSPRWWEAVL